MYVWIQCLYCGWRRRVWLYPDEDVPACTTCKTNAQVRRISWDADPFGYEKGKR